MKKQINKLIILSLILSIVIFSCDVVGLGTLLILEGPVLEIDLPESRQPVDGKFLMKGTISSLNDIDYIEIIATYHSQITKKEETLPIKWRCYAGEKWQYFLNNTWHEIEPLELTIDNVTETYSAQWNGNKKSAVWIVPIDITIISGFVLEDGQYQFKAISYDVVGNSDEHSVKTRVVLVDTIAPMVTISNPNLFHKFDFNEPGTELDNLHKIDGDPSKANWQDVQYLGKFYNGEMTLQYQIEDVENDVWSIDIRFYDSAVIDPEGVNEEDYIYRAFINDANNRPSAPPANLTVKPNGNFTVPDLSNDPEPIRTANNITHHQKVKITDKTTILVIVRCVSISGVEMQEKSLGYFIYWPDSDKPWLTFPSQFKDSYNPANSSDAYPIFPSSKISVTAYDLDDGVDRVEYTIRRINKVTGAEEGVIISPNDGNEDPDDPDTFNPRINDAKTRVFSWSLKPPANTGVFKITATVFDITKPNAKSQSFSIYFEVMDISFPEIRAPHIPVSSRPMYEYLDPAQTINQWTLRVEGIATAESGIDHVAMVWINPNSANYAAMSQLAYFRDANYEGWSKMPAVRGNIPGTDTLYDEDYPNKVWNMNLSAPIENQITNRKEYTYSAVINLSEYLNIQPGAQDKDFLKSQVFVLKVTDSNPIESKSAMITWSPQGDTEAPTINIEKVKILNTAGNPKVFKDDNGQDIDELIPGTFVQPISQFESGDIIEVYGNWHEDATRVLNIQNILRQFLVITVNNQIMDGLRFTSLDITPSTGNAVTGTWKATGTVAGISGTATHKFIAEQLKDSLVVTAKLTDIGGASTEKQASWLIESDNLRFLRVGSTTPDGIYTIGEKINIFLEFNKPVRLKTGRANPVLNLNTTGGIAGQATYNGSSLVDFADEANDYTKPATMHHFTYTVTAGQTTPVTGDERLQKLTLNGITVAANTFSNADYPYTWETLTGEEIRMVSGNQTPPAGVSYHTHTLPTTGVNDMYALHSGKNIKIDTVNPLLSTIHPNIRTGFYSTGSTIYITLNFNEQIQLGTGAEAPRLVTNIKSASPSKTETPIIQTQVNDKSVIFSYNILENDTTDFADLRILRLDGEIYDLASNKYLKGAGITNQDLTDIKVHAIEPPVPTLTIEKGIDDSVYTSVPGLASHNLNNVYFSQMFIKITGAGDSSQYERIQYSVNGGSDWAEYNKALPRMEITSPGQKTFIARQIDRAGNVSKETTHIILNWDIGPLLQRITSSLGNGIYTNTTQANPVSPNVDSIPITLYFRKPVRFITNPTFTLNARATNNTSNKVTITPGTTAGSGASWVTGSSATTYTFDYRVREYDTTDYAGNGYLGNNGETGPFLVLESMSGHAVLDEYGTDVTAFVDFTHITASRTNLHNYKRFEIQTGFPSRVGNPVFINNPYHPVLLESNPNQPNQGQMHDDDSYWTTLVLKFDKEVFAGSSDKTITIIQSPAGYRLPAVLSETQRARYRTAIERLNNDLTTPVSKLGFTALFDRFYKEGTNGYITGQGADTTRKYILDGQWDIYATAPNANGTDIQKFAELFRQAEKIQLQVNSMMVTVDGDTATVLLTGANALKVPAASYIVSYDSGFVQDVVGSPCFAETGFTIQSPRSDYRCNTCQRIYTANTGLACGHTATTQRNIVTRPFIRVNKPKEVIGIQTGSPVRPRYFIENWEDMGQAGMRMDCRTPGSEVRYTFTDSNQPSVTANINWEWAKQNEGVPRLFNPPANLPNAYGSGTGGTANHAYNDPGQPAVPTSASNAFTAATGSVPVGEKGTSSTYTYQGFRRRVRAAGFLPAQNGLPAVISSVEAEEIIYRSVLTFDAIVHAYNVPGGTNQAKSLAIRSGDQLWVRGANTMTATTAPGFPLTNSDTNWNGIQTGNSRAGIRLMQMIVAPANRTSTGNSGSGTTRTFTLANNGFNPGDTILAGSTTYYIVNPTLNTFQVSLTPGGTVADPGTGNLTFQSMNISRWQWVTWDLNTSAYVSVFNGRWLASDETGVSDAELKNRAYQYGPMRFTTHIDNWTALKEYCPVFPGGHRWLNNRDPVQTAGSGRIDGMTLNATYDQRANLASSISNGQ